MTRMAANHSMPNRSQPQTLFHLKTMFSGTAVVINTPRNVTITADAIYDAE